MKRKLLYIVQGQRVSRKIQKDFEKKTGIKVEMFQGTTGKILARMEAEKKNPVVDVVVICIITSDGRIKERGSNVSL